MTSVRIDQNLASELLARAKRKGATAADVVAVEGGSASVQVRLSAVDKLSKAQEKRLGLRVYFGRRSAGASTSDLSPASLDELVETTCAVAPIAVQDGLMQRDYWYTVGRKLNRLDSPEAVGQEAGRRTVRRLGARKITTCRVPVVFEPEIAGSFLGNLCSAVNGYAIYKGASYLVGRLGERIAPDMATPEAIVRSVTRGLYVTELIGFGINMVTGDYSRGAVGFWIENGELAYPVEEITIAGNLRDMWMGVEAIGNDLVFRGRIASPTVKIAEMTVAGE